MSKVLVIGAAGVFGSRLCEGLLRNGFEVVAAGRSLAKVECEAARLRAPFPQGRITAVTLDTATVTPEALKATGAVIVADMAGPFQGAGHTTARAAVEAGLHYVDIADARDFVAAFPALDEQARAAGVVALTGCSSTPALSNAVLDRVTEGWREVRSVEAVISPGARAPRGLSVTRAILSWLGRPVRVFEGGRWTTRPGWSGLHVRDCGASGRRLVSLCETPDLDLFVERFRPTEKAWFLAGLDPWHIHLAVWLLGLLVRLFRFDPAPLSAPLMAMSRIGTSLGSDRGAMRVEAVGLDRDGRAIRAVWRLVAPPVVGPFTPTLPALAAIRRIAAGMIEPGARSCVGVLPLQAIVDEMAPHGLETALEVERLEPSRTSER